MSMLSTLDALDGATNATSAPRAAVFQPKVKPRVRKGGGGDARAVPKAPPVVAVDSVANSVESYFNGAPTRISKVQEVLDSQKSSDIPDVLSPEKSGDSPANGSLGPKNNAEIEGKEDEELSKGAGKSDAAVKEVIPESEQITANSMLDAGPAASDGPPIVDRDQSSNLNSDVDNATGNVSPPVAMRSGFPVPPRAGVTSPAREDVELAAASLSNSKEPLCDASVAQVTENSSYPDPAKLPSTKGKNTKTFPKPSVHKSHAPLIKKRGEIVVEKESTIMDAGLNTPLSENVSTTASGRKRKFPHSTSQPRGQKKETSLEAEKSKTDLSNPGKLTMREIIQRAEAIERKKAKESGSKKSAQPDAKQKPPVREEPELPRDVLSHAPQVQVINGRIVVNESSLTIGAYATSRQDTHNYTRVEENASRLNYHTYSNRVMTERWKKEENEIFYKALQQFGTDFELIQNLFPTRTRRQIKSKFKNEERNNPRRLADALAHRPKDQSHYEDMISRLKPDDPNENGEDPFANILAYRKEPAPAEQVPEDL